MRLAIHKGNHSRNEVSVAGMLKRPLSCLHSKVLLVATMVFVTSLTTSMTTAMSPRDLASLAFPRHRATSDVGDILSDYPDYLQFVLEVGKSTDSTTTKRLADTYQALKRRNPQGAARFLKGLRFEMIQKLELMGMPPAAVTTNTPEVRRWVGRFLKAWYREADEYLFRAIALR